MPDYAPGRLAAPSALGPMTVAMLICNTLDATHRADVDAAQFGRLSLRKAAGTEAQRGEDLVFRVGEPDRLYAVQSGAERGTTCGISDLGGF